MILLSRQKLRIGARDRKIAATAMVNHAPLLSANSSGMDEALSLDGGLL